jgi:hypothetical protein
MTSLSAATLPKLNAGVSLPRYDRRQVTTGIVHISVGNFHRSHQAMYIDALMNSGAAMDWGICGIGLQPSNTRMRDVMAAQDGLYTLVLRHGDGTWDARVIGSIIEFLFAADDPDRVAHHHRRRLQPRRRHRGIRFLSRGRRRRPAARSHPAYRFRASDRSAGSSPGARHSGVHHPVLR